MSSEPALSPRRAETAVVQRRTVAVLSAAQILGGLGVAVGVAVGALIAADIAGTDGAGGLAQTFSVLGAAVAAVPLGRLSRRRGRRAGLATGMATGAAGAAVVVLASVVRSLPLLLGGLLLFGAATAAGLQARYGAMDLAAPRRAARALATVVWATTVGSVLGPNLAEPAGRFGGLIGLPPLAGPFFIAMLCFACAATVLVILLRPDPLLLAQREATHDDPESAKAGFLTTLRLIVARPRALIGLVAVASSHMAMVSVMVMTPVHMHHVAVTLTVIGLVISVHIVGMYGLSPLTGWLADSVGRVPVVLGGAVLTAVAAVVSGAAPGGSVVQLGIGLFLLGLGWSCGIVAGSALLSESMPAASRTSAQGVSDLVMNGAAALGGSVAGVVVAQASYASLGFGTAILMAAIALLQAAGSRARPDHR
ncbi:MFS transporter [Amycolatopsis alkalitolerans]|uniref:MFS transporter n=1 Tax=Amycolatopsis alkalitolerans TaxID=2547244 RepID=UPI00190F30D0|nr:MFS transporter [Amycolatopsis alkalitolerans]